MATEPPPRIVGKFEQIWRDWLHFFWKFVSDHVDDFDEHTGGGTPTSPATGLSWNAHGNTAHGGATTPLFIDDGTFYTYSPGFVGNTPTEFESAGVYSAMAFIPAWAAFRVGYNEAGTPWSDANIGDVSFAFGTNAIASSSNTIALGYYAQATGIESVAIGSEADASGNYSVSIGRTAEAAGVSSIAAGQSAFANNVNAVALGYATRATGSESSAIGSSARATDQGAVALGFSLNSDGLNSVTVGSGVGANARMTNNQANSMYIGVNSTEPTVILNNLIGGAGTFSDVGIIQKNPLSTLDIGGSVGFKYTNLPAAAEIEKILTALDNEYTFRIDLVAGNYTIELPLLSTVDRRVYYFKTTQIGSAATGQLFINPNEVDFIDDSSGGKLPVGTGTFYGAGESMLLFGNGADQTWWIQ